MTTTVCEAAPTIPTIPTTSPMREQAEDLSAFLAATPMCDSGTSTVRTLAEVVTRDAHTQREAAVALFYWVRDRIEYTMGDWNWRASETLRVRKGTCSNKANLLVAMARSLGIPAAFHVQYVTTTSYFRGAFIPMVQRAVRDKAIHVYVTLFLDGQWVKCDPTDDTALCEAVQAIVPHAQAFAFDGEHDAVLPFAAGSILSDRGPFTDIDDDLAREARISPALKTMFARFVSFMRDNGARYRQHDSEAQRMRIQADFCRFLAENDPEAYAALVRELPAAA